METGLCSCSNSESTTLSNCYRNYFHMLGTGYSDYFEKIDDYLYYTSGVDTVCSYYGALQKCLGDTVIGDCINSNGFYQTFGGRNNNDMTANYFEFQFLCGKGKNAYKNQLSCLDKLYPDCPTNIDTCSKAKTDINCYANAAKKSCGQDGYYFMYNQLSIRWCHSNLHCDTCTNGTEAIGFSFITIFVSVILLYIF
uniref:Transmembrane protein n=1 Tax=Panagrolaimus superbus TaxID=310955 RepID=A0A914XVZ4_9BILA